MGKMEIQDIPLGDIIIGKGQVRTRGVDKELDELVASIEKIGLVEPIAVVPEANGKYEVIAGQRRFLAHQKLKRDVITAVIHNREIDDIGKRTISLTENLVRRNLESQDLIDSCTALYKHYGTLGMVVKETGLPYNKVSEYVKYPQLIEPLKKMVDDGNLQLKHALRAQKAATDKDKKISENDAIAFAKEFAGLSGVQQVSIVKARKENPAANIDTVIEAAKSGKTTQVIIDLGSMAHTALGEYAVKEGTNQKDAAMGLITEGLTEKGFIDPDNG